MSDVDTLLGVAGETELFLKFVTVDMDMDMDKLIRAISGVPLFKGGSISRSPGQGGSGVPSRKSL